MIDLCVITGASRGLGYEMAKILHAQGKTLLLIARGEISIAGPNVFTCEADLSKIEAIATVMQMFEQLLDVNNLRSVSLLNNAGAVEPITFAEKCSATDTFNAISLNLSAVIQLSCGFLERTNNLACPRKKYLIFRPVRQPRLIGAGAITVPLRREWIILHGVLGRSRNFIEIQHLL